VEVFLYGNQGIDIIWGCSGYLLSTDDFRYRLLAHDKSHIAVPSSYYVANLFWQPRGNQVEPQTRSLGNSEPDGVYE